MWVFRCLPSRLGLRESADDAEPVTRACATWVTFIIYNTILLTSCLVVCVYVGLARFGHAWRVRWLPKLSPRATRAANWRIIGVLFVCFGPVWLVSGAEELREPSAFAITSAVERRLTSPERGLIRLVLGAELLLLGTLALWPKLREVVQSRLASMGEGVATAAGYDACRRAAPSHLCSRPRHLATGSILDLRLSSARGHAPAI